MDIFNTWKCLAQSEQPKIRFKIDSVTFQQIEIHLNLALKNSLQEKREVL